MAFKILIVEDHADSARVASLLLAKLGHEVLIAEDCKKALAINAAEQPEILLCDIGLPDGDGCDLLKELRRERQLTAIAVSGYGMERDHQRFVKAGFQEVVTKPYTIDDLKAAIVRADDARRRSETGESDGK